jgi:hypothetical protein
MLSDHRRAADAVRELRLWLRWWNEIEKLVDEHPGPWLASVTRAGASIFERSR